LRSFASFAVQPSAEGRNFHPPHPGVGVLLKTNVKPQFDRSVTERSKPLFTLFSTSNPVGLLLPF
jgi:hypothetical protein